jgi:predicted nucleic acid-binding Zn ribbon protein
MNDDELDFTNAQKLVRQRQYFSPRPKQAANVIAQLMARKGYGQQQAAEELSSVWKNIVGENFCAQTQVGLIRLGVLEVIVASSVLIQRLEFEKKRLLAELKRHLPNNQLKDIRFRIGKLTPHD